MKAARVHSFGPIDTLRIDEIPIPIPAPGEALVKIAFSGLNRCDTEFVQGGYGGVARTDAGRQRQVFPQTPGLEPVGRVVETTSTESGLCVGDRVLVHSHFSCGQCELCTTGRDNMCADMRVLGTQTPGLGGFADYIAISTENLFRIPDEVSFEDAATVGVQIATAWWMIRYRAAVRSRQIVLVNGATGGLGLASIQAIRACGAIPIAVTRNPARRDALLAVGAAEVLIASTSPSVSQQVRSLYPVGADVVIECLGGDAWPESLASAKQGGKIVVAGGHAGAIVPLHLGVVFAKQLEIVGTARAPRWIIPECLRLVTDGTVRIPIDSVFQFTDIVAALERLDRSEHVGKILVAMHDLTTPDAYDRTSFTGDTCS